ncbi:MAG: 2-isopropylmalate synthase [Methanobacteriaceae archaeon]|nr:2-isopropylmalate synthase [Methanobacteriaceae archaeon]
MTYNLEKSNMVYNPPKNVTVYDTTLRDGEQTPGVTITPDEKRLIAQKLDNLGVDIIELGFPAASYGEQELFKKIKEENLNAEISGLSRALKNDIDKAIETDIEYIHVFIGTSPLHRKYKLKMNKSEIIQRAVDSVEYIKDHGIKTEFSAEDATRTEFEYLLEVCKSVQEVKVDKINIPDTVGISIPRQINQIITDLKKEITVPLSIHCHNDLGLAVANSLAAVEAGANQIQCTVNGLGERAGNASLEESVMALKTAYNINTSIDTRQIYNISESISRITGIKMPPNKAIIGENAFAHEAGIHVQGILENSNTYEAISPEVVGHKRRIVLGKLTGKSAIQSKLDEYNIKLTSKQFKQLYTQIKEMGDHGKTITDLDFRALSENIQGKPKKERIKLVGVSVMTGNNTLPTASVSLKIDDKIKEGAKTGVGPIDAALNAIRDIVKELIDINLDEYHIEAVTGGTNALGEVFVVTSDEKHNKATGRSTSSDIVMASIDAVLNSINKLLMIN